MSDDSDARDRANAERGGIATQMRRLETYVNDARARGEDVPPEAVLMIERLKELVGALDELTSSMKPEQKAE